jgi:hypothetical protein
MNLKELNKVNDSVEVDYDRILHEVIEEAKDEG